MTEKKTARQFALNEAIMDQRGVNWIVENTQFCQLKENEFIAEIAAVWVNLFLLGMFDKDTQQTHKVVDTRRLIVNGDEMWHLKLRENEQS